jgi:hypothetical protein
VYCRAKVFLEQLAMRFHAYICRRTLALTLTMEAGKVRRNILIFVYCPVSCYVGLNTKIWNTLN